MATIGEKLRGTRREQSLTIEDVAHETRIHPNMISGIEADDFSMFASVSYAKSFIRKYAEFLGVDVSSALTVLDEGVTAPFGENEFLDEMKKTIQKDRRFRLERRPRWARRRSDKPGGAPIFLNLILIALIGALAVFYFLGYRANSPEEAKIEIAKGLKKANPFASKSEDSVPGREEAIAPSPTKGNEEPAVSAPESPGSETIAVARPIPEESQSPEVPIEKPEVKLDFVDNPPPLVPAEAPAPETEGASEAEPGTMPRSRGTLEMSFSEDRVAPIRQDELPPVGTADEPAATLRPEGTDPAARVQRNVPDRTDEANSGSDGETPLRAVPVARAE